MISKQTSKVTIDKAGRPVVRKSYERAVAPAREVRRAAGK